MGPVNRDVIGQVGTQGSSSAQGRGSSWVLVPVVWAVESSGSC